MSDENKISFYRYAGLVLSVATVICGLFCFLYSYSHTLNYFEPGAAVYILYVLLAADIIFAFSSLFVLPKTHTGYCHCPDRNKNPMAAIPALGSLLYVCVLLYNKIILSGKANIMLIFIAVVSAVYFLCLAFISNLAPSAYAILSLFPIVLLIFGIVDSYFDYSIEMNSPVKLFLQFGAVFSMLFIFTEVRFALRKPMPGLFFASAFFASALSGTAGISYALLFFNGRYENLTYLGLSAFLSSLFIYTLFSVTSFASWKPLPENEVIGPEDIDSESDKESAEVTDTHGLERKQDQASEQTAKATDSQEQNPQSADADDSIEKNNTEGE